MTPTKQPDTDSFARLSAIEVRGDELARIEGGHSGIDGCIPQRPIIKGPYVPPIPLDPHRPITPR